MEKKPVGTTSRIWISLFLFYTVIVLIVSSIVLYIMPHGRVAYWSGWRLLGLSKDQWEAVHVISGIGMIIFAVWHTILNWKPLKNYLVKRESLVSAVVVVICIAATIFGLPPFSTIINFEQRIKRSWERSLPSAPLPHAELMTLRDLCQKENIPLQTAVTLLHQSGISASPDETLQEIAKNNNLSPVRVYNLIKGVGRNFNQRSGMGFGRMTLKEVCLMNGLTIDRCLDKLQKEGIVASPDETLRAIAAKNGVLPRDIAAIISR
ncbi:DUF4405 domain-containing protein [Desulfurobacterium indicum]|uniref:Flavinylation-associated cytochrome domain-containing protein n=1 Tax=Desulfurobacterium indicum TaxID=1914305 RepID=A0A1R1MK79_9BACT|nr:DUF4405 domain-containing protein [Desulfurobacterium indicum]OMH40166.1 hypothetical protein BLW93_06595 [Desulfurobacterium indicum]